MERLLSGVREISTIDAGLARERPESVELSSLVRAVIEGFRLREGERVRFVLDAREGETWFVEASPDRLRQVFENVLDNAVSFSPGGSAVAVGVSAREDEVVTTVRDGGPGIPASNVARIFDRFFTHRPDSSRARTGHTGLGLAIVKTIVEGYGGSVEAHNLEQGGAMFTIRLPRAR